jgi:hypothetical protein
MLVWATPVFAGLMTQIRKGLPSFAKPPKTILVAGAYESHRMIYIGLAFAIMMGVMGFLLISHFSVRRMPGWWSFWVFGLLQVLVLLYAALRWIGPLRSDYTKQLVRSRFHAGRIIVMYAILLPFLLTWTVAALVFLLQIDL